VYWNDDGHTTQPDGHLRLPAIPGKETWELLAVVQDDALFVTVDSGPVPTKTDPLTPTPRVQ
jgi:hypothetical protein